MKPSFLSHPRRSFLARVVATTLVPATTLSAVPVGAEVRTPAASKARATSPAPVKVNRTLPKVRPVAMRPVLSAVPTDRELFRARIFQEPFVPIGRPATAEDVARVLVSFAVYGTFLTGEVTVVDGGREMR